MRPFGSGSANTGTTGAPVRRASAASVEVVAAGRWKNRTQMASGLCMCWSMSSATPWPSISVRSTFRTAPSR